MLIKIYNLIYPTKWTQRQYDEIDDDEILTSLLIKSIQFLWCYAVDIDWPSFIDTTTLYETSSILISQTIMKDIQFYEQAGYYTVLFGWPVGFQELGSGKSKTGEHRCVNMTHAFRCEIIFLDILSSVLPQGSKVELKLHWNFRPFL